MIAFLTNRLMKLVSKDDPFFSMLNFASDQTEDIDLWKDKFMFAVEKLDPRAGRIDAEQVFWGAKIPKKKKIKIKLVNCEELLPGGQYENQNNNKEFSIERLM